MYRDSSGRTVYSLGQRVNSRMIPSTSRPRGKGSSLRVILALGMAAFAIISYLGSKTENPITGEEQYITISQEQEIALGLQAAPEITYKFGGLEENQDYQDGVEYIGLKVVDSSFARDSGYPFDFHLLADENTVNAFALPGGQIFITDGLLFELESEDQLAGVLAHEIGHVIARHGAQQIAQQQLSQGLTGAVVLATYDPNDPRTQQTAQVAVLIGNLVTMKYGRDDELESDWLGVCMLAEAGYDPTEMIRVMEILHAASAGPRPPEFLSTHPDPGNRIQEIEFAIANLDKCP